jgi:peptidyl-prolyl cis-trans isomerase C
MRLRRWLAEPLLHFLAAGAFIFMLIGWIGSRVSDDRTIRLTRDDLLDFAQAQAQVYAAPAFDRMLETMPGEQRRRLIHTATLQEALYREGQAIALDRADPLIRQRIVQQMRFLVADEAAAGVVVGDAEVGEYYRAHGEDYRIPATVSFTHVFFSAAERGAAAEGLARAELQRLRAAQVPFEQAARHGERFLYQTNYIDSDQGLIASHFGAELARRLFAAHPSPRWQGPFRSDYGWHLVLLRQRSDARLPPLAAVRDRVRDDALAAKRARLADAALDRVLASYRVELGPGVEP